jgi:two-component system response regulator RegA
LANRFPDIKANPMVRRLLILDDEAPLVAALVRHFERRGYEATGVFTVAEATAAIESAAAGPNPFAAVLSDLQLPDGDGRDIVKLVRARLPDCPIVIMTGSRSVSGSVEAMRFGAVTVLEKPLPLETLSNEIALAIAAAADARDSADDAGEAPMSPRARAPADAISLPAEGIDLQAVLREIEERLVYEALERTQGNKNQAARVLGLNRTTLIEKIRRMARKFGPR